MTELVSFRSLTTDEIKKYFLLLIFGFLLLPGMALAETVVRTGESVSISNDQVVENDFYVTAGNISMSGEVRQDMYAVGGSVTINGPVGVDFTALSGTTQIHAPVSDDVRVIGGEVVIADHVGGDVFVIGGLLKVLSSASISGDVYFYGGEADISGSVDGSIMGAADSVRIDGAVGSGVDMIVGRGLTLGDRASVRGDVRYESPSELTRSQDAVVDGSVVRNEVDKETESWTKELPLVSAFVLIFAALCAYLFFRERLQSMVTEIYHNPGRSGLIGLLVLFLVPIAIILAFVTVLGALLGVVGLLLWLLLLSLAYVLTAVTVGALAFALVNKTPTVSLASVLFGALLIQLLYFVPVIGALAVLVCFVLTLGVLAYQIYRVFIG